MAFKGKRNGWCALALLFHSVNCFTNSWDCKANVISYLAQTEIAKLGRLSHDCIIEIIGYCAHEGEALLVYEYMPNGSLDYHLFGGRKLIQTSI